MNKLQFFAPTFVSLSLCFFVASAAHAATLYFEPKSAQLTVTQEVIATLYLDSNEGINALEGKIVYPAKYLELKDVSDGNSIVEFQIKCD